MKRSVDAWLALMLVCMLSTSPALASAGDLAAVVPSDCVVYAEVSQDKAQELLALAALPPAAGIFLPGLESPFGYLDQVLNLPIGSIQSAAPHLKGVAVAWDGEIPFLVLSFDEERWPAFVLQGAEKKPDGTASFAGGEIAAVARDGFLIVGAAHTCERLALGDYASLAAQPTFATAREAAAGVPMWAYISAPAVLEAVIEKTGDEQARLLQVFSEVSGLDQAQYITFGVRQKDGGHWLEAAMRFEGEDAALLSLVTESAPEIAADVPEGAAAVLMLNWGDASTFFGGILRLALEMNAAIGDGSLQAQLAQTEQNLGLTFNELFAQLGSGLAVYYPQAAPDKLIARQDWTAVLRLKDARGFRDSLTKLTLNTMGMLPPEIDYEGVTMSRLMMPPVAYTILGDRMVLGGNPAAVKRYLDWQSDTVRKTLRGAVSDGPATLIARVDLGRLVYSYPATQSGTKALLSLCREGELVRMTVGLEDFEIGQFYREYMTGYSAILGAMLMPALARARGEARKSMSKNNLHNIGLAIAMYRADHDDQFPPHLEVLLRVGYLEDETCFLDPADDAPVQRGEMGLNYSYQYVGPIPSNVPASTIICYSREKIHAGGRNVLHNDLAVMWVTEDQLHASGVGRGSLYDSYDAVVEAFGDELTEERKAELKEFYEIEE